MGDASTTTTLQIPKQEEELHMPPGFRFHPTDVEIVLSYLLEKVQDAAFSCLAIGEVELNGCEPWDLPTRAKMGEKEWFFFWHRDRKYPTGTRTNRATKRGYWKATGKDREIYKGKGCLVGMKKTLVFYLGRAPKGEKTNWVMHEYRLEGKPLHSHFSKNDWVVCRVFHKNEPKKNEEGMMSRPPNCLSLDPSHGFDRFMSSPTMPPLSDSSPTYTTPNNNNMSSSGCLPAYCMLENHHGNIPFYPNPPGYYDAPPVPWFVPFQDQRNVEYLHHGRAETGDALRGKCKVEEQPPRSRSMVESGGRSWEDPRSPSCSGGPLTDLEEYIWT